MIYVKMFGPFSLSYGGVTVSETDNRMKKVWRLMKYIAAKRGSVVHRDELIRIVGSSDNADNISSLKTMMHRCRNTIDQLKHPNGRSLILQKEDGYCWNPAVPCAFDADLFCKYADAGDDESEGGKTQSRLKALEIYTGFYLGRAFEELPDLAKDIQEMHLKYIALFEKCAKQLEARSEYELLSKISESAISIDPYQEVFHYHLIRSCIDLGDHEKALRCYDRVNLLFNSRFRVKPSDRIRSLYRYIISDRQPLVADISDLIEEILKDPDNNKPLACDFDTFKAVSLTYLNRLRGANGARFALFTVAPKNGSVHPGKKQLERAAADLADTIQNCAGPRSVFTRYGAAQFAAIIFETEMRALETLDLIRSSFSNLDRSSPLTLVIESKQF